MDALRMGKQFVTFQTIEYAVLLTLVIGIYWWLPRRLQNLLLLVASYVFYAYADPRMALLIGTYTVVNYASVRAIDRDPKNASQYLVLTIVATMVTLGFFKYSGFFVENLSAVLDTVGLASSDSTLKIILPIGISFYTFQSLGYVVDVYMGRTFARRDLIDTALFISFFPQLVSGPIERASDLLPQFERVRTFCPDRIASGLSLAVWGLFKKLVIADNVGLIVDNIFATSNPGSAMLWTGVFAFGIQLLADFSGYTDIARGSARLLGIELSLNFHHPWLAKSPQEFWQRWHITLSTWLRDYVYIPLGGNGRSRHRTALNVVITFMLGGLWHGAAWNFILWGLFHAGLILIWQSVSKFNIRSINGISTVLTFFMIGGGWVLFREQDLTFILENVFASNRDIHLATTVAATSALYSIPIWLHSVAEHSKLPDYWTRNYLSRTLGFTALTLVSLMGIMLLRAESSADFIYFRF